MGEKKKLVPCAYCGKLFRQTRATHVCCSRDCGRRHAGSRPERMKGEPCHQCGAPGVVRMCKKWWCGDCLNTNVEGYEELERERAVYGSSMLSLAEERGDPTVSLTAKERRGIGL